MIGKFFRFLFLCLFLFIYPVNAAQKILLESSVNKSLITEAETVVYSVKVSAEDRNAFDALVLPDFSKDFSIVERRQGSSFRMINGVVSQSQSRIFRLKPLRLGEIKIPPARIEFKNETYLSVTTSVQVVSANVTNNEPVEKNADIFIETKLSKSSVFVGEPVTYDLVMYRRMQLWGQVHYSIPTFDGFWPEQIGNSGDRDSIINGKRYYVTPIVSVQLFPTESGDYTFEPATALVQTNVFGARLSLKDSPVTLNVAPLPLKNKPAKFSNLVGEFDIALTDVTFPNLKENQPISILVTVSGTGNVQQIQEVDVLNNENFNVYLSRFVDTYSNESNSVIARTFEYVVLPRVSGIEYFPQFSINYFSPELLDYEEKKTQKVSVRILPDQASSVDDSESGDSIKQSEATLISTVDGLTETEKATFETGVMFAKKHAYGDAVYVFLGLQNAHPYNKSIRHNLGIVRGLMTEDIGQGQVKRFYYELSLMMRSVFRFALLFSVVLCLGLYVFIMIKKQWRFIPTIAFVMLPIIFLFSTGLMLTNMGEQLVDAVVMPSKVALKSGPSFALDTKVFLYSGTVVNIQAKRNGFSKISLENDIEGWLDDTALKYFD